VPHWKLTLAYDGTPYHGWQVQPGLPTVQGTLSDALHRIAGERVLPQGSGRTDTGVHALGQVASFTLAACIPPANLLRALNNLLPASIRILTAEPYPLHFHARHSAIAKTYEYRIFPLKSPSDTSRNSAVPEHICPPTLAPYVWPCRWPLTLDLLNRAAHHIVGTHDFTSFAASDPDLTARQGDLSVFPDYAKNAVISSEGGALAAVVERPPHFAFAPATTAVRTITHSHWHSHDNLLIYTVTGSGFLHHMVRNLVGTFVMAGSHRLSPDAIPTILAARNRSAAGPTAPASGLFLVSVDYAHH
jgi:tRNA pseudouridine38-40 synthase